MRGLLRVLVFLCCCSLASPQNSNSLLRDLLTKLRRDTGLQHNPNLVLRRGPKGVTLFTQKSLPATQPIVTFRVGAYLSGKLYSMSRQGKRVLDLLERMVSSNKGRMRVPQETVFSTLAAVQIAALRSSGPLSNWHAYFEMLPRNFTRAHRWGALAINAVKGTELFDEIRYSKQAEERLTTALCPALLNVGPAKGIAVQFCTTL